MTPILARSHEVRAMLAGGVFCIVRPLKGDMRIYDKAMTSGENAYFYVSGAKGFRQMRLPYAPGDLVCVKEAWENSIGAPDEISYLATAINDGWMHEEIGEAKWRPAQHMRLEHSRLTLSVSDVVVKRLHDVTSTEAFNAGHHEFYGGREPRHIGDHPSYTMMDFKEVWDQHNRDYPWDSNPWIVAAKCTVHHKNIKDVKEIAA